MGLFRLCITGSPVSVFNSECIRRLMLKELRIENFAIIDELEILFAPNLNIFTGETGAGKSIIIDAVEALLGGRVDSSMIRAGEDRANLEGVFEIPPQNKTALHEILQREELLDDPDLVLLGREIRSTGRNIARVNGRATSTNLLRELGEYLVDVHGQSEHLSLLRVKQHQSLLDNFAHAIQAVDPKSNQAIETLIADYAALYQQFHALQRELEHLQTAEQDAARRADLLTYQINEIESARLRPNEEAELQEERNRLANAEGLASLTQQALQALDESNPETPAASDLIGQVETALINLARLDPSQEELAAQAQALVEDLAEIASALRAYQDTIEFNPRRLDQVEERLDLIHNLKRKYGASIDRVLKFAAQAKQDLEEITHASERIQELEIRRNQLLSQIGETGQALARARRAAGERMAKEIENELVDLQMPGARFQVEYRPIPEAPLAPLPDGGQTGFDALGIERIEFLIAPNPGEGFKPLVKIASGGETSRLMLALKNVLAQADQVPTLVFDEIDQGIGGRVGAVVGKKLWQLAEQHQVLCITHLPQLAAFGEAHFRVAKAQDAGRTTTQVSFLDDEERLSELAQMMGQLSENTLRSAREMRQSVPQRPRVKASSR